MNTSVPVQSTSVEEVSAALRHAATLSPRSRPVVVGVDGSAESTRAVDWALEEAVSRGVGLHIVSAYAWNLLPVWSTRAADDKILADLRRDAESVVRIAVDAARAGKPAVEVTGEVLRGATPDVLAELGRGAGLLVVGSRHATSVGRAVLGSVSALVAGYASCPVVVRCGPPSGDTQRAAVVVGVAPDETAGAALEFAFAYASRRNLPLRAVLAVPLPLISVPENAVPPVEADIWLSEALAGHRTRYPDVEVHRVIDVEHTVGALVAAGYGQHLLVVGRRGAYEHPGMHLGSVSQRVLHHADLPVAVVPQDWVA